MALPVKQEVVITHLSFLPQIIDENGSVLPPGREGDIAIRMDTKRPFTFFTRYLVSRKWACRAPAEACSVVCIHTGRSPGHKRCCGSSQFDRVLTCKTSVLPPVLLQTYCVISSSVSALGISFPSGTSTHKLLRSRGGKQAVKDTMGSVQRGKTCL